MWFKLKWFDDTVDRSLSLLARAHTEDWVNTWRAGLLQYDNLESGVSSPTLQVAEGYLGDRPTLHDLQEPENQNLLAIALSELDAPLTASLLK